LVVLKRRGHSRADLHQLRQGFRALFLGTGEFRDRLDAVAAKYAAVPLVRKVIDFLREGGSRSPMMPPLGRGGERPEASAMNE
jgi:UDP-N-acetylglucosamine acyltransferase